MPLTITKTNYAGEVVEHVFTQLTTGNALVERGLVHVLVGVKDTIHIPKVKLKGDIIQGRVKEPASSNYVGEFEWSEETLQPNDMMVLMDWDPSKFEHVWRKYQPKGNLVFQELPANVQNLLLDLILRTTHQSLGKLYIQGSKASGNKMDGILTKLAANADVKVVDPVGKTTMVSRLAAMRAVVPEAMRNASNLRILMSIADADTYDDELAAQPSKGVDYTAVNRMRYKGIPIEALPNWPQGVILWTLASPGEDSNLFVAVNLVDDADVLKVGPKDNVGEIYFAKMLFKADTGVGFGDECIVIDFRTTPVFKPAGASSASMGVAVGGDGGMGVPVGGDGSMGVHTSGAETVTVTSENLKVMRDTLKAIGVDISDTSTVAYTQSVIDTLTDEQRIAFDAAQ